MCVYAVQEIVKYFINIQIQCAYRVHEKRTVRLRCFLVPHQFFKTENLNIKLKSRIFDNENVSL